MYTHIYIGTCLHVCTALRVCLMAWKAEEGIDSPVTRVTYGCEPLCI